MSIGDKIRELRKAKSWSQKELSRELDIHPVNITKLETGKNMPSVDTLVKLSKIFNVAVDYILSDELEPIESSELKDKELLASFKKVEKMDDRSKEIVKELLDSFILKQEIGEMIQKKKDPDSGV
ncbi:MAG: helix-turn-helix transcriptional regulator [bacterium]|nr:helix-turn-helix transcriptional regulator [bacterium]